MPGLMYNRMAANSRNPVTGLREFFDPGDQEGAQDPGFDGGFDAGDYGGMDPGSFGAMEGDYSGVADYSGPGISDFGADMEDSPAETPFDFGQYAKAQAWGDYNRGYDVAKAMPFGLGLFARAINMGVQHGVLPEPMTRSELAMDRADWAARGPMTGGVGTDRGMAESGIPKNGLAPSTPRGFQTPQAPTYLKYMQEVQPA